MQLAKAMGRYYPKANARMGSYRCEIREKSGALNSDEQDRLSLLRCDFIR